MKKMASGWDFGSGDEMYESEGSGDEADEKGMSNQGETREYVASQVLDRGVNGCSPISSRSLAPPASELFNVAHWRGPPLWNNAMFSAARFPAPANTPLGGVAGPAPVSQHAWGDDEGHLAHTPLLLTGDAWDSPVEEKDSGWEEQSDPAASDVSPQWHELLIFEGCLANLKKAWAENSSEAKAPVKALIREVLEECRNPYQFLVYMVSHSGNGGQKGKHCLPRAVLLEFQDWKSKLTPAELEERGVKLLQAHQVEVLEAIGIVFPHYIDDLCCTFELQDAPRDERLRVIEEAITASRYKDAVLCAVKLGMRGSVGLQQLLLPLVALDKMNVIESYLHGDMGLQRSFVTLVDQICSKGIEYIAQVNRCVFPQPFTSCAHTHTHTHTSGVSCCPLIWGRQLLVRPWFVVGGVGS